MGEAALSYKYHTVAEYVALEESSNEKHYYRKGRIIAVSEIFGMAGGRPNHALLQSNIQRGIGNALTKNNKPCLTYSSDLQIALSDDEYIYADGSVICGEIEFYEDNYLAAKNPILIIEVLSDSSEKYDRGDKFREYRQIKSFREYVLISQNQIWVEVYFKPEKIDFWQYKSYHSLDETVKLQSIDCEVSMSEIYLGWIESNKNVKKE